MLFQIYCFTAVVDTLASARDTSVDAAVGAKDYVQDLLINAKDSTYDTVSKAGDKLEDARSGIVHKGHGNFFFF